MLKTQGAFWRKNIAPRAAVFVDMADYLVAAKAAMSKAKRSVHLLNWAFEATTPFTPEPGSDGTKAEGFGAFLKALAAANPDLDVRLLCWDAALPVAATQSFFPIMDRKAFAGSAVKFKLDSKVPFGACHHQKMIVIDDAVAFCGGADVGPDRWDSVLHTDDDPRRERPGAHGKCYDSRHEVMAIVDGPPAKDLGDLFRERWHRCTGETLPAPAPLPPEAWPNDAVPILRGASIGISRTMPAWRDEPPVREIEQLTLASIASAKSTIYMENQYFTSPLVAEAIAARLAEPAGPEVVLISTQHSPSYFDQMTMDRTRVQFIKRLREADPGGRVFIYCPVTLLGRIIIVHAKLAIIDDALLRIGSANMNNRSSGYDSECDLTFEAGGAQEVELRSSIRALRTRLIAHWLGCPDALVDETLAREGRLGATIEALRSSGHARLQPIPERPLSPMATLIAAYHLGDPVTAWDSFRPWRRARQIARDMQRVKASPVSET